ncbi:hypothetical protein G6F31_019967 [Rhizopus arrhizus]|nr:hypothetical protein G6F31_019967 [Rhizopus arrhizus]
MESDAATIALDPSQYRERRAARVAALQSSSLPDGVKAKLLGESESTLAYAAGAATIDRDPHGAVQAFDAAAHPAATDARADANGPHRYPGPRGAGPIHRPCAACRWRGG